MTALRKQIEDLREAALARRRVEDALRSRLELLQQTVDVAPVGICHLDRRGKPRIVNAAFVRRMGYASLEDFRTLSPLRGLFPSDAEIPRLIRAAENRPSAPLQARFCSMDGAETCCWCRLGVAPPPDEGIIIILADSGTATTESEGRLAAG